MSIKRGFDLQVFAESPSLESAVTAAEFAGGVAAPIVPAASPTPIIDSSMRGLMPPAPEHPAPPPVAQEPEYDEDEDTPVTERRLIELLNTMPAAAPPVLPRQPQQRMPSAEEQRQYFLAQSERDQFSAIDELVNARVRAALQQFDANVIAPIEAETLSAVEFRETAKMARDPKYRDMSKLEGDIAGILEQHPEWRETMAPKQYLHFAYLEAAFNKVPQAIEQAAKTVRNEVMKEQSAGFFSIGQNPGRGPATGAGHTTQLSADERAWASRMGVSEAQYAAFKATNNRGGQQ